MSCEFIAGLAAGAVAGAITMLVFIDPSGRFSVGPTALAPHSIGLGAVRPPIKYRDCDDCSLLSRQIAWSLDNQPELWDTDGFHVDRRGGGSMWIANGAYYIGLGSSDSSTHPGRPDLTPHDQGLLWGAYQRWLEWSVTR